MAEKKRAHEDDSYGLSLGLVPLKALRWEDEEWPLDRYFGPNGEPHHPFRTAQNVDAGRLEGIEQIGCEYLVAGVGPCTPFSADDDYAEHDLSEANKLLIRSSTSRRAPRRRPESDWDRWRRDPGSSGRT